MGLYGWCFVFYGPQTDVLSETEQESLLRNDLRPTTKSFKGNKLFLRFATQGEDLSCRKTCFISDSTLYGSIIVTYDYSHLELICSSWCICNCKYKICYFSQADNH